MPHLTRTGLAVLGAALGLSALATSAQAAPKGTQSVAIRFAAVAGDAPVACGQPIAGLGTTNATAQLADLRFFVSDVKLIRADGKAVALRPTAGKSAYRATSGSSSVTLVDLENGAGSCAAEGNAGTNAVVRGRVPKGRYVGARWTVGVPSALNHTDAPAAPAPLNSAAMAWSWQAGRKFLKIELTDPAGATGSWTAKTFLVHLGSAGCTGNPATGATVACKLSNRASIRLARFDPAKQDVAVDLKALLAGNDITANRAGAPGCMSGPTDPECGGVFASLGIGWRADGTGNGASPAATPQTLFRAVAR
jgi:uncharacterized repeat protein (TIGR04052 family)